MINSTKKRYSKVFSFFLKIILAVIFLTAVFYWFNPSAILRVVKDVSLWLYGIVVLGHFLLMAIKSLRWKILLESFDIHCTYLQAFKAYIVAFSFGTFTPGQLGDMAKVMLIDGAKGKRKLALIPSFADRAWDLLGLVAVSAGCTSFFYSIRLNFLNVIFGSVFILCVLAFMLLLYRKLHKFFLQKSNTDISVIFSTWQWSAFLTLVVVIIQFFRWVVLALAMSLPVITAASSAMIGTLVALIPVSFGGLGTREAAIAWLFTSAGLSPEAGVGFSLLMFGSYLIGALAGAVVLGGYGKFTLVGKKGDRVE